MNLPRRQRGKDDGFSALEVVALTPVVLMMLAVIAYSGRREAAQGDTEAAAQTGARTISIARDPHGAIAEARAAAVDTLDVGSVRCESFSFATSIGEEAVTVTVECRVAVHDLIGVVPVGSTTLSSTATEVLDTWREQP